MVSKAKRAANDRWDAANMSAVSVKAKRELVEDFRAVCARRGETANGVLRQAMEDYIARED